jgi:hypothetical protein
MNTSAKWFVLLASVAWTTHLSHAQEIADAAAPVIALSGTNEVALGAITSEHLKLVTFIFKNPGTVPVEITDVTATCPCIRGFPMKALIPPGGEQAITVELNPRLVKKAFRRSVWVKTTAAGKSQRLIPLFVNGEIVPLFDGMPSEKLTYRLDEVGETWTTNLNLTATATNLFLSTPIVASNEMVRIVASLKTNLAEKTSYELTLTLTALEIGRGFASVQIPFNGRSDLPPLEIWFTGRTGAELTVAPDKFLLLPSKKTITRSFIVRTMDKEADPALVSFSPQRDGITYETVANKTNRRNFSVRVTVTPEGLQKLFAEKEPKVTVQFPKHKSAEISFTAQ